MVGMLMGEARLLVPRLGRVLTVDNRLGRVGPAADELGWTCRAPDEREEFFFAPVSPKVSSARSAGAVAK